MTTRTSEAAIGGELGELLRYWRGTRGKSQIDLSLDTGVSQRHLSFIESGRSVPSRQTLVTIAQGLDVPFRDRNLLLLAAGFAPIYSEDAWNADEMKSVNAALERVLRQHEPFPAVVMDRHWDVRMTNASAPRFFNLFIDLDARPLPRNLLQLMFDPAGMRPFIAHWERTAKSLVQRVHRESVGQVIDEDTRDLLATLMAYPEVEDGLALAGAATPQPTLPMIPLSFVKDGRMLNYFSMVTTVGTPLTIATQELRIECMYPADDQTDMQHRALIATGRSDRSGAGAGAGGARG